MDMLLAREIPSAQYGYWLPLYSDGDARTVKQIVLRAFRDLVIHKKYFDNWNLLRIKNFQIIEHKPGNCACTADGTYGWKCEIVFRRATKEFPNGL